MRKYLLILASIMMGLVVGTAQAQTSGPSHPGIDAAMAKLFGDNPSFMATMEIHSQLPSGNEMIMPGKIAYLDGKSRFDMDMADTRGLKLPPKALSQMKQMGMNRMASITIPSRNVTYVIYPDIRAYVEAPATPGKSTDPADYRSEVTNLGTERTGGHKCVKNRVVVTGPDGIHHESVVWDAVDLNQFPLKIESAAPHGATAVLVFKDVKLQRPEADQFEVPADFTKYNDEMGLMMSRMKKGQ